jgi:hypothetical protein
MAILRVYCVECCTLILSLGLGDSWVSIWCVAVDKLSVVFSTDDSLLSKVIRCRTNSEYSHVDLSINGGGFISSTPFVGVLSAATVDYPSMFKFDFFDH